MEIVQNVSIHNRFDIEVRDAKTGILKQRAKAENMILDRMYTKICNLEAYFTYINFGKGTGTLSAVRTTLFSSIAGVSATVVETIMNTPPTASYIKEKIVLVPESYNGNSITEVGISDSTTAINTHALLTDSEGNQISIAKTSSDEITIYATIYIQLSDSSRLKYVGFPNYNSLLKYLTTGTKAYLNDPSCRIMVSSDKTDTNITTNYANPSILAYLIARFEVYDSTNKKISTPVTRFQTGVGNGHVWSILWYRNTYESLARILLPATSIWEGYHFVNKQVGTGDGSTKTFNLPWSEINTAKGYTIYKNGIALAEGTDYTLSNTVATTSVTFITAPASGNAITADFWVDYIPKDADHVVDIQFTIQFGEGA